MKPRDLIRAIQIMEPHFENGAETTYFWGGEHDIVYFYVGPEKIPEDSSEGQELIAIGFFVDSDTDSWAKFT